MIPDRSFHIWRNANGIELELTLPTWLVKPLITSPRIPSCSSFMFVNRTIDVPAWCGST